ncbi:MAG: hypothetical protein HY901_17745 [Deltaproteobacteria bacterium]|nr:hypothetical protein [Deltaproteobacteria bacterium]
MDESAARDSIATYRRKGGGAGIHWSLPVLVMGLAAGGALLAIGGSLFTHPTAGVPGDPDRFDPIAAFPKVHDYAGEKAQLVSMVLLFVSSDGTMDLGATPQPAPTAIYTFVREAQDPKVSGSKYENVTIMVAEPWRNVSYGQGEEAISYLCRGMDRTISHAGGIPTEAIPEPRCSLADLWKVALAHGAKQESLANVNYGPAGYLFTTQTPKVSLRFGADCRLR